MDALALAAQMIEDRVALDTRRTTWVRDPTGWARDRVNTHLWSKQREIAASVVEHRRTAVRSAHGVGKSFTAATLGAWWLDTHPLGSAMVVTTAPSYEQVHAVLWEELRRLHRVGDLPGEVQRADRWIADDGSLIGIGRRPPDHQESAFQGIHKRYVLAILDEAGGIPAWLWTAVEAITTGRDCRILAIGNPDDASSEFARICTDPGWHTMRISAFDSPNLTGEQVPDELSEVLVSREWVEDRRARWGEDNPLYRAKVLGEFADNEDSLIPMSWVSAAQQRWRDWCDAGKPAQPGRKIVSVDVARYGDDKTAIAIRFGDVLDSITEYSKLDTVETATLVDREARLVQQTTTIVDDNGLGAGVTDQLKHKGRSVRAFNGSHKTAMRDSSGMWRFRNVRSASYWNLREMLDPANAPTIAFPPNDDLAAQLCAPRWTTHAGGFIEVESKDQIKKRLGRSPDMADSVVMAFWAARTPEVADSANPRRSRVHKHRGSDTWE